MIGEKSKFDQVRSILIHFGQILSDLVKKCWPWLFSWKVWQLFILTFFDRWEIQIGSGLIHFDPFWTDFIWSGQKKLTMYILMIKVTTFYCNIFWLVRIPIWSSLIHFDPFWTDLIQKIQKQSSHFYPFCKYDNFLL